MRIFWEIGETELEYQGRIERIGGEIAAASGGIRVFAELLDASVDTPLRPGAFVRIELDDRAYSQVAPVPDTALYGENQVFVVQDGRLRTRAVEVIGYDGETMLLGAASENPLRNGEQVVITQLREAGDNAPRPDRGLADR